MIVVYKGLSGSGLDRPERIDFLCLDTLFLSLRTHLIVS